MTFTLAKIYEVGFVQLTEQISGLTPLLLSHC